SRLALASRLRRTCPQNSPLLLNFCLNSVRVRPLFKRRIMNSTLAGISVSPVNMADRKALGTRAGDTVRVHQKIEEKGKTRLQVFEGVVLARKHGDEPGATFTVRKVASGVGVEKIFPLYSPLIDKIEIVKRSKVRRAKLYFIR